MKISYRFVKGQAVVIEVDEDLGNVIIDLRHKESNNNRKETRRRHLIPKNKDTGEEISIDEFLADKSKCVEEDVLNKIENERLRQAMERLLPEQRELLIKVYYQNNKLIDLAKEYGVSFQAIQNRLKKIYEKLKKFLI